jgi:hypothetical protein
MKKGAKRVHAGATERSSVYLPYKEKFKKIRLVVWVEFGKTTSVVGSFIKNFLRGKGATEKYGERIGR